MGHWDWSQYLSVIGGAIGNLGTMIYLLRQVLGKLNSIEQKIREITEDVRECNKRIDSTNQRIDVAESKIFTLLLVERSDHGGMSE